MSRRICHLPLTELSRLLAEKQISAVETVEAYLSYIYKLEPLVHAYIRIDADGARRAAAASDARRAAGKACGPLDGIPLAVKDNICTEGLLSTCASRMLENFVPPYDAHVITLLKNAGAVFLGKTNMDEFGMGSTTETSYFGPTFNPRALRHVPGGSSGGSAAAAAAFLCAAALGSDTGGSVRQPAAFCGVTGLKPTYGAVSRRGLVAFASSLDQIGPIARHAGDAALLYEAIRGRDPEDCTSVGSGSAPEKRRTSLAGLQIALPRECFGEGLASSVREDLLSAVQTAVSLGAEAEEVSVPELRDALPAYYILSSAEASSNLARYDGVAYGRRAPGGGSVEELVRRSRSEGFGDEVKRRILLGTFVLSAGYFDAYYARAQQVRERLSARFASLFEDYDLILTPVSPAPAPLIGEKLSPEERYLSDIYTVPANIAGLPALSMPCSSRPLPTGLQLMAKPFAERLLLDTAALLEQALDCKTALDPAVEAKICADGGAEQ